MGTDQRLRFSPSAGRGSVTVLPAGL